MIGYGKRVWVVDDEAAMRQALTEQLEWHGFLVVQAEDSRQALRELQLRHFDAVITDYLMPHCNGLDFLRQSQMAWPNLPVILMLNVPEQVTQLAVAWGALACLPKPFAPRLLLSLLRNAGDRHISS